MGDHSFHAVVTLQLARTTSRRRAGTTTRSRSATRAPASAALEDAVAQVMWRTVPRAHPHPPRRGRRRPPRGSARRARSQRPPSWLTGRGEAAFARGVAPPARQAPPATHEKSLRRGPRRVRPRGRPNDGRLRDPMAGAARPPRPASLPWRRHRKDQETCSEPAFDAELTLLDSDALLVQWSPGHVNSRRGPGGRVRRGLASARRQERGWLLGARRGQADGGRTGGSPGKPPNLPLEHGPVAFRRTPLTGGAPGDGRSRGRCASRC